MPCHNTVSYYDPLSPWRLQPSLVLCAGSLSVVVKIDRGAMRVIQRMLRILLVAGNLLIVLSLFVPWYTLSTQFANPFGSGGFSPWTGISRVLLLHQPLSMLAVIGFAFFVLVIGIIVSSLLLLRRASTSSNSSERLRVVGFALTTLMVVGVLLAILPDGLGLVYPYFDVVTRAGGWVAAVGLLCVLSSSVFLSRSRAC